MGIQKVPISVKQGNFASHSRQVQIANPSRELPFWTGCTELELGLIVHLPTCASHVTFSCLDQIFTT